MTAVPRAEDAPAPEPATPPEPTTGVDPVAAGVVALLAAQGRTLAVAESLTGGALASRIVSAPGASAVLRGAVVAYATDLKASLLGVDEALLAARGAVDAEVASRMADGVRARLGADVGISTTGVAGPTPQDGKDPGTVFVAVSTETGTHVRAAQFSGDRAAVRRGAVDLALDLLAGEVGGNPTASADLSDHSRGPEHLRASEQPGAPEQPGTPEQQEDVLR